MCDSSEYEIAFKYLNPWKIKTPKNYSCLFVNPLNTEESGIRIISGIVDTDEYPENVNFPFFLKKLKKDEVFVLKKNDPIALVFPFLRDNWKMKIKEQTKKSRDKNLESQFKLFSFIKDGYKRTVWKRKNYD